MTASEEEAGEIEAHQIPRCDAMDGSSLRIVRDYTEAGRFCEARCVTISDGVRAAVYVPVSVAKDVPPMADEIPGQNVVRVEWDGELWRAWCGPDPDSGPFAWGYTPTGALMALAIRIEGLGYVFDPSWRADGRYDAE